MAGKLELYAWADRAAKHVRFFPDRAGVRKELQEHMEDRYEALTAGGLDERAAAEKTVAAMGDADQVGEALNKIHAPLLGWLWLLSCGLIAAALVLGFLHMSGRADHATWPNRLWDSESFTETTRDVLDAIDGEWHGQIRAGLWESGAAGTCGDYSFTVPKAALWTHTGVDDGRYDLFLQLRVSRKFWTPHFTWTGLSGFFLLDSLGGRYDYARGWYAAEYMGDFLTSGWDIVLHDFPTDAEWVELHYHREGYDLVLRVDLKGGEGYRGRDT